MSDLAVIEIPLTKGFATQVDAIDADLADFKWCVDSGAKINPYATRATPRVNGKQGRQYVHRIILERALGRSLRSGEVSDHINGDSLDNRRENLRLATVQQNHWNRRISSSSKTGLKGASFDTHNKKWVSQIGVNGKVIRIGEYDSAEAAHNAYCFAAIKYHGEFARLA